MKKLILLVVMAAMALVGCQKSELVGPTGSNDVFTATVEGFCSQTKTSLTPENYVVWSADDRLAIFQGSAIADEYKLAEGSEGLNGGSFQWVAKDNVVNGDFNAGTELPCNVAFYPYSQRLILKGDMQDDGKKIFTLANVMFPEIQYYAENSFGNGAFPMVAVTANVADHNLKFKNVGGAMKLQLKGSMAVKSIKIEGANGERLSGAASVTAYANNLPPAITMTSTDEASKSVTLDCGDGVQLNTTEAIDFFIALPPVLFQNGFTVIVTDVEEKEYTVTATDANTVLRSSILVMPEVLFEDSGEGAPEEDEEELVIPVLSVSFNSTSLKLYEGDSAQLEVKVKPVDATNKSVVWSSDDPTIATVDQSGLVIAVSEGTTKIYAVAEGKTATCSVTVKVPAVATVDYIDEYGINHGKGTAIGMAVWAPVNCGYHATDYKWGKLYQWGRKYGQGYNGPLDVNGYEVGTYADSSVPTIEEGGVSAITGQHKSKSNVFFTSTSEYNYDWLYPQDDYLWNNGTESEPVKTENDPCPEGWRVPTYAELEELSKNHSEWTINENSQSGCWFSAPSSYSSEAAQVFFPAAGCRDYGNGNANLRGYNGVCWSSRPSGSRACSLRFGSSSANMGNSHCANGFSVRCVQE